MISNSLGYSPTPHPDPRLWVGEARSNFTVGAEKVILAHQPPPSSLSPKQHSSEQSPDNRIAN
jgi:hypothetical protein